jgi:hypothetical protein
MKKVRTTLTIDEDVLRAVKVRAARSGKGDSQVIEEALRRELGLDLLERLWSRSDLSEEEAMKLAVEAQHKTGVGALNCGQFSIPTYLSPRCFHREVHLRNYFSPGERHVRAGGLFKTDCRVRACLRISKDPKANWRAGG